MKREPSGAGRIFGGAIFTFGSRLFSGGLRYFTGLAIARLFGAEVYGQFAVGTVILLVLATVSGGGAMSGLMGLAAERIETGGRGAAGRAIRICRNRTWGIALVAAAILVAIGFLAPGLLGAASAPASFLGIAVSFPFLSVSNVLESGTRGLKTTRYEVLLRCVVQPVLFLGLLVGLRSAGGTTSLIWFAYAASVATEWVLAEVVVSRLFPKAPAPEGEAPIALGGNFFHDAAVVAVAGLDLWLVGLLASRAEAGYYGASVRTVDVVVVLLGSFQMLLAPTFSSLLASGRQEELPGLAAVLSRGMYLLALAVGLPLSLGAREILGFFGPGFPEAAPALALLAVFPVFGALAAPSAAILLLRDPRRLGFVRLSSGLVTALVTIGLWPELRLAAPALGAGLGLLVANGAIVRAVPEGRGALRGVGTIVELLLLPAIPAVAVLGFGPLVDPLPPWLSLLIRFVAADALLLATWWLLPGSKEERRALGKIAADLLRKARERAGTDRVDGIS